MSVVPARGREREFCERAGPRTHPQISWHEYPNLNVAPQVPQNVKAGAP
jgi:hypothetical protein